MEDEMNFIVDTAKESMEQALGAFGKRNAQY